MIIGGKIKLCDKRLADARDDYNWRTDLELAQLDAAPLLKISYPHYLLEYTSELHFSSLTRRRFSIQTVDGKHIGNCLYYDINDNKGEAELGIMIGNRDYWNKGYGADAVTTLLRYIFNQTKLNRIYLKTLELNCRAQKCFRKCGFTACGHLFRDGYSFMLMEVHRKQWQEQTET